MERNIIECNIEIAKMLNWSCKPTSNSLLWDVNIHNIHLQKTNEELQFHYNYNWIMEAVSFITSYYQNNITSSDTKISKDIVYTMKLLSDGGYWLSSTNRQEKRYFHTIYDIFESVYEYALIYNKKYNI